VETPIRPQKQIENKNISQKKTAGVLHHGQKMTVHMISSLILWLALCIICADAFLPWTRASEPKFLTKRSKLFASSFNEPTTSLTSVLQELNRRGIRYLPDASRQDLISLLQNENAKNVESDPPKSKTVTSNLPPTRQPIQELLKELDDRGIPFPSRGSRAELEQLLVEAKHGAKVHRPLREILQMLDDLDIPFSPSASREELETLLEKTLSKFENNGKEDELQSSRERIIESDDTPDRVYDRESFEDDDNDDGPLKAQREQPRRSIRDLLQALDDRGIQYPSRGSRAELEHLLKSSLNFHPRSTRSEESTKTDDLLEKRVEEVDPSARSPKTEARRKPFSTRSEVLDSSAHPREQRVRTREPEVPQSKRERSDSTFPPSARENQGPRKPSTETEDRMIRRQRRLQRQESTAAPLQSIFTKIPKVTAKAVTETISPRVVQVGQRAANAAVRKVKKVSRDAVQFIMEEEEDEEVDETPVQPERVVEVEPLPMDQELTTNKGFSPPSETESEDVNPRSRNSRRTGDKYESNSSRTSPPPFPRRPIRDIIDDLNRAGVPYAARASRNELEELLASKSKKERETTAELVPPTSSSPDGSQASATWGDLLTKTKTRLDNGRRKVSRRVSSFRSTGSEGDILDAIIEDYSRDDILIDVKAEAIPAYDTVKKARRVQHRNPSSAGYRSNTGNSSRSDRVASPRTASSRRSSQNSGNRNPSASRTRRPSSGASRSPLSGNYPLPPLLPPKFDEEDLLSERYQPKKKQRGSRRPSGGKRKIYSPYVSDHPEDDQGDRDSFDQFGEFGDFVANAADSFIWGPEEGNTKTSSTRRRRERPEQDEGPPGRDRRRVHWKDKMEMNFDQIMGIHEDGNVYNRWEEEEVEGGRTERKRPKKRRKGVYERPMWEEEGSVLSMLFGNRSQSFLDGRSSSFNRPGSLVKLFQSLSRAFLILASGIARWATVRGALPQYVVVLGVAAAGLSARPGNRLWVLGLTLIAMRTMGELIHGYSYDDFEFDSDDEIDEDEVGPIEDSE
jgi:hypothetical protein